MLKARYHEMRLYLSNRPLTTILGEFSGLFRVVYFPFVGYVINDPKIGLEVLNNETVFTSSGRGGMGGMITPVLGENALVNMEGAAHRELKQKLLSFFGKKELEQVVTQDAAELLQSFKSDLQAGKTVDLVPLVRRLTILTNLSILGIPPNPDPQFYDKVAELAIKLSALMKFEKLEPSPKDMIEAQKYASGIWSLIEPDLPDSKLKTLGLSDADAKGLLMVLFIAGTETVTAGLPRLIALLLDSGKYKTLLNQPELVPKAIDEGLRLLSPSPAILRGVRQDTGIDGVQFKKNRRVIVMLYKILKRKEHFANPRRFDLEREIDQKLKHLWFGNGAHFCLGFGLARREMEAVLNLLLNLGQIEIVERRYPRHQSFPGYTRLLIRKI
jgi:cytochrome P450